MMDDVDVDDYEQDDVLDKEQYDFLDDTFYASPANSPGISSVVVSPPPPRSNRTPIIFKKYGSNRSMSEVETTLLIVFRAGTLGLRDYVIS